MSLFSKSIITTLLIVLFSPITHADVKIYFNTPAYQHHYKPYYYPSYHRYKYNQYRGNRYYRPHSNYYKRKNNYSYYKHKNKNPYHELNKKYQKRNYRHHAIELGYYDKQRNQKKRQTFKLGN